MKSISKVIETALTEGTYQYNYAEINEDGDVEIEKMVLTRSGAKELLENEIFISFKSMLDEYGESNE